MTDRSVLPVDKGSAWRALRADPGFAPALALAVVSTSMAVTSPPAWVARMPDGIALVASGLRRDEQGLRLREQAMAEAEQASRDRDRQVASLQLAAAERQRVVDDLRGQLQVTRERLALSQASTTAHMDEASRLRAEVQRSTQDAALASQRLNDAERSLQQAKSQTQQLAADLDMARTEAQATARAESAAVNAMQGRLNEARLANEQLKDAVARLQTQLQVTMASRQPADVARISQLDGDVSGLKKQLEAARVARQPADVARIAELEAQLTSSQQSLDRGGIAIAATESKLAAAGQTIRGLESDLTAARQALKLEQERVVEQQRVGANRVAELEATLAQAESMSGRQQAELEAATDRVAALKAEADAGRSQLGRLLTLLGAASAQSQRQEEIIDKQKAAIGAAGAVADFNRYRIEFLDRLKAVVGDREGFAVAGDRATIQSEVLFASGSAELSPTGRAQLQRIAASLRLLAPSIPPDLDWVLQVDGHTDRLPIRTAEFKSNWELSASRAIAVVRVMIDSGIAPRRLSANGFGEHRPVSFGDSSADLARNRRIELSLISR